VVGLGRVELPTYGLGNRRSIHLSYSPVSDWSYFTSFRKKEAEQFKWRDPSNRENFVLQAETLRRGEAGYEFHNFTPIWLSGAKVVNSLDTG
jgi:hypothetical protein